MNTLEFAKEIPPEKLALIFKDSEYNLILPLHISRGGQNE